MFNRHAYFILIFHPVESERTENDDKQKKKEKKYGFVWLLFKLRRLRTAENISCNIRFLKQVLIYFCTNIQNISHRVRNAIKLWLLKFSRTPLKIRSHQKLEIFCLELYFVDLPIHVEFISIEERCGRINHLEDSERKHQIKNVVLKLSTKQKKKLCSQT